MGMSSQSFCFEMTLQTVAVLRAAGKIVCRSDNSRMEGCTHLVVLHAERPMHGRFGINCSG